MKHLPPRLIASFRSLVFMLHLKLRCVVASQNIQGTIPFCAGGGEALRLPAASADVDG